MEKEQFEELIKTFKELNERLANIGSCLGEIDNTLDLILERLRQFH